MCDLEHPNLVTGKLWRPTRRRRPRTAGRSDRARPTIRVCGTPSGTISTGEARFNLFRHVVRGTAEQLTDQPRCSRRGRRKAARSGTPARATTPASARGPAPANSSSCSKHVPARQPQRQVAAGRVTNRDHAAEIEGEGLPRSSADDRWRPPHPQRSRASRRRGRRPAGTRCSRSRSRRR